MLRAIYNFIRSIGSILSSVFNLITFLVKFLIDIFKALLEFLRIMPVSVDYVTKSLTYFVPSFLTASLVLIIGFGVAIAAYKWVRN